jgi:osmotically-inducible protein OsmY
LKSDDSALQKTISRRLKLQPFVTPWSIDIVAHDGVVDIFGFVESQTEKEAAQIIAETTRDVVAVNNYLVRWPVAHVSVPNFRPARGSAPR